MVVALLERLRATRYIAIVAEDRQPAAHPQRCVLCHVLRQDVAVVIICILGDNTTNPQRVVGHHLDPIVDGTLTVGQDRLILIPDGNIGNWRGI